MDRELKFIEIRDDATIIRVGKATELIVQPSEWHGVPQIQVARRGPMAGPLPEFRDIKVSERTPEMHRVQHLVNITPELFDVLVGMGRPGGETASEPKPIPRKRPVRSK